MSYEQWTGVTAKATDSQVFADGQLKERSPKTTSPHVPVDTHTHRTSRMSQDGLIVTEPAQECYAHISLEKSCWQCPQQSARQCQLDMLTHWRVANRRSSSRHVSGPGFMCL